MFAPKFDLEKYQELAKTVTHHYLDECLERAACDPPVGIVYQDKLDNYPNEKVHYV